MSKMTDPNEGLISYVEAYANGLIKPSQCTYHNDLYVLMDYAEGEPRLTYALIENGVVRGIANFVKLSPIDNTPCFGIGYAVSEKFRRQGFGTKLVQKSIDEIKNSHKKHAKAIYIEALVSQSNSASNKIAKMALSSSPMPCIDSVSGEPAYQYLKLLS